MSRNTIGSSEPGTDAGPHRSTRTTALTGGVVGFLIVMELGSGMLQGWYPPLLGAIGTEYGVSAASLNWIGAIYMLATVVCVPIIAKLGDLFGHKRLLVIASALVALGSIVVALAPSFEVMLLGRALQAPLAAFLPLEFAIVRDRDERSAGRSIGRLVGALTIGAALGSLGAGLLYGLVPDLAVVLWVPAVFLALCVPVVVFLVPETTTRKSGRIDWIGASLLGIGLLAFLTGISNASSWGWTDPRTLASIIGGLALLAGWVRFEQRTTDPLVDLRVLTSGGMGLPMVTAFLFGAQLFGGQTASLLYAVGDPDTVGYGLGLAPTAAGLLIVFAALAAFIGTLIGDRVARRISPRRTIALGGLLIASSFALLAAVPGGFPTFVLWLVIGGLGSGLIMSVLPTVIVRRAPADSVGIASALYNTSRTAAGAVSGAAFALVMSSFVTTIGSGPDASVVSTPFSFLAVWVICAGIGVAIAVLALRFDPSVDRMSVAAAAEPTTAPAAPEGAAA